MIQVFEGDGVAHEGLTVIVYALSCEYMQMENPLKPTEQWPFIQIVMGTPKLAEELEAKIREAEPYPTLVIRVHVKIKDVWRPIMFLPPISEVADLKVSYQVVSFIPTFA